MTLLKVQFGSGVIKDDTPLASEGGWVDADRIRFRQGMPQTIGGYEFASTDTFEGIARGGHSWADLLGQPQVAFGTAAKLYAFSGGALIDITPPISEGVLINPFEMKSGSPTVTVIDDEHGLSAGQTVTFRNADAVGGLTIDGPYQVARIITRGRYEITAASNATGAATGGGNVDFVAQMSPGLVDGTGGLGYGTGGYSVGPYGVPSVTDFLPAVWSLDHFGENLLANRRGGPLYQWQPGSVTANPLLLNPDFASDTVWAKGTGWTISGGAARKASGTAAALSQNVQGVMTPGKVYRATFDILNRTAGTIKLQINAGTTTPVLIDVGQASTPINKNGSYSRLFIAPADTIDAALVADGAFVGAVDSFQIVEETKAYRINEAPTRIDSFFVDPNGFVVLLGTEELDGDYNPMLVRWSGQRNVRQWIPNTDNLTREIALAKGGRLIGGLASRQQNLIWSDDALYSMQFTGDADLVYSFPLLGTGCGLVGRHGAAEHNGIAFWLGNNGNFYIFQGAIPQVIDCRVRAYVVENIAPAQEEKVFAGINGEFSEVWFFYPDQRDGGECSRYAAFNWIENHWTIGTFNRSTWIPRGVVSSPIALGTDNRIYYHEIGTTANGAALGDFIESADFDIQDGDTLLAITRLVPDFERQLCPIDITLTTKLWPNAPDMQSSVHRAMQASTMLNMRRLGRQARIRLASVGAPSSWRFGALRMDTIQTGARR